MVQYRNYRVGRVVRTGSRKFLDSSFVYHQLSTWESYCTTKKMRRVQRQLPQLHRTYHFVAGSCSLPHPSKKKTGGEDAHFIDRFTVGVADGVGGWQTKVSVHPFPGHPSDPAGGN